MQSLTIIISTCSSFSLLVNNFLFISSEISQILKKELNTKEEIKPMTGQRSNLTHRRKDSQIYWQCKGYYRAVCVVSQYHPSTACPFSLLHSISKATVQEFTAMMSAA